MNPQITRYDTTYVPGEDFGVITCVKCDCRVLYGLESDTRPRYCPKCESVERLKVMESTFFNRLSDRQRELWISSELRMRTVPIKKKTIQEICNEFRS